VALVPPGAPVDPQVHLVWFFFFKKAHLPGAPGDLQVHLGISRCAHVIEGAPAQETVCSLCCPQQHVAINPTYLLKECCAPGRSATDLRQRNPRSRNGHVAPSAPPMRASTPQATHTGCPHTHCAAVRRCIPETTEHKLNLVPTRTHPNKKNTSLSRREAVIHRSLVNHIFTQSHYLALNKKKT
jgi:hypothetical protein